MGGYIKGQASSPYRGRIEERVGVGGFHRCFFVRCWFIPTLSLTLPLLGEGSSHLIAGGRFSGSLT